mgnify:FL=1|tara:strand:+ start:488 stop:772 length:285 start_codon:yes stop_codon:yes gene_type:complete
MKFTKEHLNILKTGVNKVLDANPNAVVMYSKGEFFRADKVKDLQKRFCFDLFYASGVKIGDGIGTYGDIIGEYTDDHLYTALKVVCPTVKWVTA